MKEVENRKLLFGDNGVAHRLAPFFETAENLNAELLLDFYTALVEQPFPMATESYYVQLEGARILGKRPKIEAAAFETRVAVVKTRVPKVSDGSYNSMDFLRCFYNVMTSVFDAPEVLFTDALWNKMLKCQRKQNEIKDLLAYFDMNVARANDFISEWRREGMNWTTFLICICEIRQAIGHDRESFIWLLEKLEARPDLIEATVDAASAIVNEGAQSKECYCVRVCNKVHEWLDSVGQHISTHEAAW